MTLIFKTIFKWENVKTYFYDRFTEVYTVHKLSNNYVALYVPTCYHNGSYAEMKTLTRHIKRS